MKRFQELLMKDLGWKLLSVAIAATLWFMVISINQPIDTRTYSTTLQITGEETLTARGLTIANLQDLEGTKISIKVKAQRTALDRLSQRQADLITASIDVSGLSYVQSGDQVTLPIDVQVGNGASGYTVESKVPGTAEVWVETLSSKEFPVEVVLNGELPQETTLSDPYLSSETVMVRGAQSAVNRVVAVRVSVNATEAAEQGEISVRPIAYDREGNTVTDVTFSADSVTVSYRLHEEKQIPIQISVVGTPASGYHVGEITYSPNSITVIGTAEDLRNLTLLSLGEIDVTDATSTVSQSFLLTDFLPEGVALQTGSSRTVQVLVHMEQGAEKTVFVSKDQITLQNTVDGYQYILPDTISVIISGETAALNETGGTDCSGTVDVGGLEAGAHTVTVDWTMPDGISAQESVLTVEVRADAGTDGEEMAE